MWLEICCQVTFMKILSSRMNSTLTAACFAVAVSFLLQPVNAVLASPAPASPSAKVVSRQILNGIHETRFSNGLTVLSKEVHNAPVVYFSVWYQVGSSNEQLGQTGMSHLLEHMLFKGTSTRGPGEISALLQRNGAQFNASTSIDRTNYYETLASDRLEMAMALEADRMVNSLFDTTEHRNEMTVVRSEYEGGENSPGSALNKAVRLAAYQVHPYRWPTIGFKADIENTSRDEMFAYYKKYYVPNNATIVMVGDFQTDQALELVRRYFGAIPSRPLPRPFITPEPEQQGERRVMVRRAGTTRQILIAYRVPEFNHPDSFALDVLQSVLSDGRTSRFFNRLEQTGLATAAVTYSHGLRFPDLIYLSAQAQPGKTNEELEKALLDEVEKLQSTPIAPEELQRVLNQAEAHFIYEKDSVQAQGGQLGEDAMRGDWRFGETYLEKLKAVTPADVQRVAQKYLVERHRTVGYFEPTTGTTNASTANVSTANSTLTNPALTNPTLTNPTLTNAPPTKVASSPSAAKPVLATAQLGSTPARAPSSHSAARPTRVVLENGVTVIVQPNHANSTISLSGALLSAGSVLDPADKRGIASFTASLLSRGTQSRSLLEIASTLENRGASASVSGGSEHVSLSARSLTRDFETVLDILADQLRNPAFPPEELEKARSQTLAAIENARQSTSALARIAFMRALYPAGHPYRDATLDEMSAVVKSLTREDIVAFHKARYGPERLVLTIVGDVEPARAVEAVKKYFGDWSPKGNLPEVSIPDVTNTQLGAAPTIINLPDKAQANVLYGYIGRLRRSDPDFYPVVVMNTILGGGMNSRLFKNVRDRLGVVYSINSNIDATLGQGPFTIGFGANPQNVQRAVSEMRRQLTLSREEGFTSEEVAAAIDYLSGSYAVTLATNGAVAGQLLVAEVYGLGLDYIGQRNNLYRAVTTEQVNAAAKKYLSPNSGALVIAGTYSE
jgi:zinc protease